LDQYDAIGWAPKEYNPDDKQNSNSESQKDGGTAQSGFVWDEKSGYYYDSASGFYYDGTTGKSMSLPHQNFVKTTTNVVGNVMVMDLFSIYVLICNLVCCRPLL
jgi:hypothetical protein